MFAIGKSIKKVTGGSAEKQKGNIFGNKLGCLFLMTRSISVRAGLA